MAHGLTALPAFRPDQVPISRLFKNNRDGTFTDVTQKSGLGHSGWGQGCCVGDYDNDGWNDLFVTYYGQNMLYRNNGDGTFTDVTAKAGLLQPPGPGGRPRWNSGCAFLDYNKDGNLDLFVANYIDFDIKTAPLPEAAHCTYKGIQVACGPPGLEGGKNILYHNNGDGTFTDVSEKAGILDTIGTYGLSVAVADLDNDGWPDIYVANDSTSATFYRNQKDGTFKDEAIESGIAYSPGRQTTGRHGRKYRGFQSRRLAGYCKDKLRRGYRLAIRQPWATVTLKIRPTARVWVSTPAISAGGWASLTRTTMAGSTF